MMWRCAIDDGAGESAWTIRDGAIRWGRTEINRQPDPATCSVSLIRETSTDTYPVEDLVIGSQIRVWRTTGTYGPTRFWGEISDIRFNRYTIELTAVSPMAARIGFTANYQNPLVPGPYYDMVERQTGDLIGIQYDNITNTYPVMTNFEIGEGAGADWYDQGLFRPWDHITAFVSGEPSGVIGENFLKNSLSNPSNVYELRFTDATVRRNTTPDLTLTGDEILDDWVVVQQTSDKVTQVTASTDANPYFTVWPAGETTYQFSDTNLGTYSNTVGCTYANPSSARNAATCILGLQYMAGYRLKSVTIPMDALDGTRQTAILDAVRLSNLVRIPELIPGFPTDYFIEGADDNISTPYTLTLYLSEASLTHPPDRWTDVNPSLDWAGVPSTMTWQDAYKQRFT